MSNESKIPMAAPRTRPIPGQTQTALTEAEKQQKQQEIINNAPLHTKQDYNYHPPEEQFVQQVIHDAQTKPWRQGMGLPVESLMQIRKKTSITMATEHELRLAYLVNDRNLKRGFGPKVYVNDLINEAIEQYTKAELKKLGFDTK